MESIDLGYRIVKVNNLARELQKISGDVSAEPWAEMANIAYEMSYHLQNIINYCEEKTHG